MTSREAGARLRCSVWLLQESDDDESVVSSRFSDLGSPPASNLSVTPTTFNRKLLETSTNTPASHAPAAKSKVVKNLFDDSADAAEKGPARSTRSQRPLVDKAMEELVAEAMRSNRDLRGAAARLKSARQGVIIGRALFNQVFTLEEAIAIAS